MSAPKIPQSSREAPSIPTRMDDPAALAAREDALRNSASLGYNSTRLAPFDAAPPITQRKMLLGL